MQTAFSLERLTKRYGSATALDDIDLAIDPGHVVGLVGRNGSGKTTLIHHLVGLVLPTFGRCHTLGCNAAKLGSSELSRIGIAHQEHRYIEWMSVAQHLRYVASFYKRWDWQRQERLLDALELNPKARVGKLSPGDVQKLGILLAVCHHPELLLLDEPASSLDPIARARLLSFLLELLQEDECTLLISSHILRDIEQIVDWVVCLDQGRICANTSLDQLQESYASWQLTAQNGSLPDHFDEDFILAQTSTTWQAQLVVHTASDRQAEFAQKYGVEIASTPLNLEQIFPYLLESAP